MFKLVVLSALLAVAVAKPGHLTSSPLVYSAPLVQEHSFAKVGAIVKTVPSAVSHQSSTVVHHSAHHVQPIVAPVVKTYAAAPIVKAVHTPLVQTFAADSWAAPARYAAAPIVKAVHTPLVQTFAADSWAAPAHFSYAASAPIAYNSAPLTYAAGW